VKSLILRGGDITCPSCTGTTGFCNCRSVAADPRLVVEWHEDNPCPTSVAVNSHQTCKWRCMVEWHEDNPCPTSVAVNSHQTRKWRCMVETCGHVWKVTPVQRNTRGTICPECRKRETGGKKCRPKLAVGRPDFIQEWDEVKNGPPSVTCGSSKNVWWRCGKSGKSWQAKVIRRAVANAAGCPNSCVMGKAATGQEGGG